MAGTPFTPYQRRLFVFLSVATFFEGYDFMVFSQILPTLRDYWELDPFDASAMYAVINCGTVAAYLLVRIADRIGRRRTLTITIAGYTVFTFATGFAPDPYTFTAAQFFARIFLIAEWAISMVYAAEEFPADRRGMVIGVIQGNSILGSVVCGGTIPFILELPWGWRSAYLIAIVPLLVLAFARRSLKETQRFVEQATSATRRGLLHIWRTPYRKRVLQLAVIWGMTYVCSQIAVAYWKDFALTERALTEKQAGLSIAIASVVAVPLVFLSGKMLDVIGRRPGAAIVLLASAAGAFFSYTLHGQWPLTFALIFGVFGVSAYLPVLNAYTTELFPTELRSDAFAWANNLLGRITYVLSPLVVGHFAKESGSWSGPVQVTAAFPILALILLLWLLPETKARELEDTASL